MTVEPNQQGPVQPAPSALLEPAQPVEQESSGVNSMFIDGKAFPLEGTLTWGYVSGVAPQEASFVVQKRWADDMVKRAKRGAVSLEMRLSQLVGVTGNQNPDDRQVIQTWTGLTMLPRTPQDYKSHRVTLTDDRYYWGREKVFRDFNLTRKANDVIVFESLPVGRRNILRDAAIYYRKRSLQDDGSVWTALEIIRYTLTEILGYDPKDLDFGFAAKSSYVPQNEIVDGEDADALIGRMMALDGNDLFIDEKGKIFVYDRTKPFTVSDFRRLFPKGFIGRTAGDMHVVDYTSLRPEHIEHLVTPKIEILCTYQGEGGATRASRIADNFDRAKAQIESGRVYVENVTRTVVDGQVVKDGKPLPRGTIVTIDEAFEGFGRFFGGNAITNDDYLRYYGGDAFLITGAVNGVKNTAGGTVATIDPTAGIMKDAIERDHRSLFQLPESVRDGLREMEALHADMLNPVTRQRAPSSVFSEVSWLVPSTIMLAKEPPHGVVLDSFTEVDGDGNRIARDKYEPISGAVVTIEDADLGLVRIDWGTDYDRPGTVKSVIPGVAVDDSYYFGNGTNYSANSRQAFSGTGIKADWECSFVISIIPDLYRDKRRLYREQRKPPAQIQGKKRVDLKGTGPRVQRRIRLDDARFTHGIAAYELNQGQNTLNPNALALGARGQFVNEKIVDALITAENDRIYRTFNPQIEGAIDIFPGKRAAKIRPEGSLRTILYTYSESGEVVVTCRAQRYGTPKNILSELPSDVLRATVRQLEPPAQGG